LAGCTRSEAFVCFAADLSDRSESLPGLATFLPTKGEGTKLARFPGFGFLTVDHGDQLSINA
jgi:hypothetical protein